MLFRKQEFFLQPSLPLSQIVGNVESDIKWSVLRLVCVVP